MKNLNPKHARFVQEYLIDLNATQAAIRAGYSQHTAKVTGSRLLTKADIASAVAAGAARQLASADLTATRTLEEIRRLAFSDVRALVTETGNLRGLHELTPEQSAAIASVEVIIKNAAAGDDHTDTVYKIRQWDKPKALEMLAKHFALLTERVDVGGGLTISWQAPST